LLKVGENFLKQYFLETLMLICVGSAERIQFWLEWNKKNMFPSFRQPISLQDWRQLHSCKQIKIPTMPSPVKHLSLHGYNLNHEKKKEKKIKRRVDLAKLQQGFCPKFDQTAKQTQCCINQKNPYQYMEEIRSYQSNLSSNRIAQWRFKAHSLAFKKLKNLKQKVKEFKAHQFAIIGSIKKTETADIPEKNYWQEQARSKGLFHIERITK
jgi:hypothetical protein